MKSKPLNKTGNFIMLSGEIDKSYTIAPGVKITFGEGSTFEGIEVAKDTTFRNNEYVVKHFTLNSLGQIELTPIPGSSSQDHEAQNPHPQGAKKSLALIIPSSGHPSAFGEDSLLELGLPEELMRQRPLAPAAEKELWNDKAPSDNGSLPPPESVSSVTPTPNEELSAHRDQSSQEEPNDIPPLSGENAKEEACCDCCLIV